MASRSRSRSPIRSPGGGDGGGGGRSRSRSRSRSYDKRERSRSRDRMRSRSLSPGGRNGGGGGDAYGDDEEGYRLHVADLDNHATKRDLERAFGNYGPLREIWMAKTIPCFAFVVYKYKEDAEDACHSTDGAEIGSRRIRVSFALPRGRGRGRKNFDPNSRCYQCGDRGHFSRDCDQGRYGYKRPPSPGGSGGRRPRY